ncbi:hypothetical protein GUJ93_ZPchr0006g41059 [Zizania palustris]|uniref:Uncharacterized protein n=1 Tax=Zizania palustris TaxID=103762 RepID=A0A8J5VLG0_ZIZPA|nr:hypothetical protein GUJ93_ZPchr0006g41059 [Zizania palustris]
MENAVAAAVAQLSEAWSQVRAPVIMPLLRLAVAVCQTMSVLLFLERMYMAVIISGVKLLRRPERRCRCDPLLDDDPELDSSVGRGAGGAEGRGASGGGGVEKAAMAMAGKKTVEERRR